MQFVAPTFVFTVNVIANRLHDTNAIAASRTYPGCSWTSCSSVGERRVCPRGLLVPIFF